LRPRGKKSRTEVETRYRDRTLDTFSGYIAVDEAYQHPFCILSLVDSRTFTRLSYRVLEHRDPTATDIHAFLADFKTCLDARGLSVHGITTDGSSLYPEPLHQLWPGVPHQVCRFHILKEILKAVLHALAQIRKTLGRQVPKLPRGRPRSDALSCAKLSHAKRVKDQIGQLFEHRHLFIRRKLTPAQSRTLQRITRGLPHLRVLRTLMEQVYQLFDRRCRTQTAFNKLTRRRRRLKRFKSLGSSLKKLQGPNVDKALTYLDDKLLAGTSNAVERGNRRFRKMQKSIYSVRTVDHIRQRLALDLLREERARRRQRTITALHRERSPTRFVL
jgi:hypothetical protein